MRSVELQAARQRRVAAAGGATRTQQRCLPSRRRGEASDGVLGVRRSAVAPLFVRGCSSEERHYSKRLINERRAIRASLRAELTRDAGRQRNRGVERIRAGLQREAWMSRSERPCALLRIKRPDTTRLMDWNNQAPAAGSKEARQSIQKFPQCNQVLQLIVVLRAERWASVARVARTLRGHSFACSPTRPSVVHEEPVGIRSTEVSPDSTPAAHARGLATLGTFDIQRVATLPQLSAFRVTICEIYWTFVV